jgi:hypothetical protein
MAWKLAGFVYYRLFSDIDRNKGYRKWRIKGQFKRDVITLIARLHDRLTLYVSLLIAAVPPHDNNVFNFKYACRPVGLPT